MKPTQFKPLCENDIDLLYHWFQEPIIKQWYAKDKHWTIEDIKQKYLPRIQAKDKVYSFIVHRNDHPIGFIQYYYLMDHLPEGIQANDNPLFKRYHPNEIIGVDIFIAHNQDRGKGLGTEIINCFIFELQLNIKAVVVDPNSTHTQAIRCYEKAGFKTSTYSDNPNNLIMIKTLD